MTQISCEIESKGRQGSTPTRRGSRTKVNPAGKFPGTGHRDLIQVRFFEPRNQRVRPRR